MTLLEAISTAVASQERVDSQSEYPFPLSQDGVFANVKKALIPLKDTNRFDRGDFLSMLKQAVSGEDWWGSCGRIWWRTLRGVSGLVLKGCVRLEMWELVETLVSSSLVDQRQASDLGASELLSILRYFPCPSKEAVSTMVKVREEWDISKLNFNEMRRFIRYLSKWMKKYERFPQAAVRLGSYGTKCLGLIIDENFSTLALHSDLHEELKVIERVADGLASESKLCSFVATVAERLKLGDAKN
ncbi:hypothetical protein Bca52824_032204 [Brassica carinata]|uniref:Uncharacterized protein n=1 Tax=Brassica carinata TaxID=52824 RepID=A0A8X7SC64_BRACI|nr:hypothetical protein Bca52824_032204 [Brassica carinata]